MSELTREILDKLAEPFPPDVIEFKPGATNGGKDKPATKALALAYVEVREYVERLNKAVGADWSDSYTFIVPTGELIMCSLTICGVTRCDIGEKDSKDVNTATSAIAQAFKRACVKFGLGRHLYDVDKVWVAYDANSKRFTSQAVDQLVRMVSGDHPKPASTPEPEHQGNGTEVAKAAFFAGILKEIPYYRNIKEVTGALKKAGFTGYAPAKEVEMRAALEKHANEAANKEAA